MPSLALLAVGLTQLALAASPVLPSTLPLSLPGSAVSAAPIADMSPVHLGVALRLGNEADLDAFLAALQDPRSPDYHHWLTPEEFGERFGQPAEAYERVATWLAAGGMTVTRFPNRLFLEAQGNAAQVNGLMSLHLTAVGALGSALHAPDRPATFPASLGGIVLHVAGLDTRVRYKHHLTGPQGNSFGPQDLRRFYNLEPLFAAGYTGQGQKLVVLGEAEADGNGPDPIAINYFLQNVSDATAPMKQDVLSNPQGDVDQAPGGGVEFSLDIEMQSVGAPDATSITLVVPPASEIFTTGVNYIVNAIPSATAVSLSIGGCEPGIQQDEAGVATSFQMLLKQALAEGQTWSAATGDQGSDACQDGATKAVDFPASIPEMVAMGGTQVDSPNWDASDALTAYQQETGWNGGAGGGAGGGGISILFPVPSYQQGLVTGGRSLPDFSLISGAPAVLYDDPFPGVLNPVQGTSIAAPLSAGFFALIASRVGCRLGDVHPTLYQLGNAQLDGGAKVFHDIVSGTAAYDGVPGPSAGIGYDSDTGWGSIDVAALAAAWPPCSLDGGITDAGPGRAYDPCGELACGGASVCTTLPEGPSSCVVACDAADAGSCGSGDVCSSQTPFSSGNTGACVVGCLDDHDCTGGNVCSTCQEQCIPAGSSSAKIGDACTQSTDCPSGATCFTSPGFLMEGYCTEACVAGGTDTACACPAGSACSQFGFTSGSVTCLQACPTIGAACGQSGFVCQPGSGQGNVCVTPCQVVNFGGGTFDTCAVFSPLFNCDTNTGVCDVLSDGGILDAGSDVGRQDSGVEAMPDAGDDAGAEDAGSGDGGSSAGSRSSGCSTSPGAPAPDVLLGLVGLIALVRRRRR